MVENNPTPPPIDLFNGLGDFSPQLEENLQSGVTPLLKPKKAKNGDTPTPDPRIPRNVKFNLYTVYNQEKILYDFMLNLKKNKQYRQFIVDALLEHFEQHGDEYL